MVACIIVFVCTRCMTCLRCVLFRVCVGVGVCAVVSRCDGRVYATVVYRICSGCADFSVCSTWPTQGARLLQLTRVYIFRLMNMTMTTTTK